MKRKIVRKLRRALADGEIRHVLREGFVTIVIKYGSSVASVLMLAALARAMPADDFGHYGFAFSLGMLLGVVGCVGQRVLAMRFGSAYLVEGDDAHLTGLLRMGYSIVLAGCGLLAVGVIVLAAYWPGLTARTHVMAAAGFTLALGLSDYQMYVLRTLGSIKLAMLPRDVVWRLLVAAIAGLSLIGILPAFTGASGIWIPALLLLAVTIGQALLHPQLRALALMRAPAAFERRTWFMVSLPIWGTSILNNAGPSLAVVIMGFVLTPAQLGGFFLVVRLSNITAIAVRALATVVSPQLGRLSHQQDLVALQKVMSASTTISSAFALSGALLYFAAGSWILGLFNPAFTDLKTILVVMSLGMVLNTLLGPGAPAMTMQGYERAALGYSLFANIVGILAILGLGIWIGPIGAALALVGTRIVSSALRAWHLWRHSGLMLFLPFQLLPGLRGPRQRGEDS